MYQKNTIFLFITVISCQRKESLLKVLLNITVSWRLGFWNSLFSRKQQLLQPWERALMLARYRSAAVEEATMGLLEPVVKTLL